MARAKVISFINYKGGVGKTTTTYHIGCSLAQHHGKKVLLVDIDPQTNLTLLCAVHEKWKEFKDRNGTIATMYHRFLDKRAIDTKRCIWRSPIVVGRQRISGLDLIPCDIDLLGEDLGGGQVSGYFPTMELLKRNSEQYIRDRLFMRRSLVEVEDDYDYVLIDCPPNLYLMTQNALVASKWYVVPTIPDHLSTIGLSILREKVGKIGTLLRAAQTFTGGSDKPLGIADLGGIIFVRVRIGGTVLVNAHASKMESIRQDFGEALCFAVHTTELIGYTEAAQSTAPIWMHSSTNASRAASRREYERITDEFVQRF
jgi:chromosome partitioning protein